MDRVRIETLDFLRGAAALYVLINHARGHLFAGGRFMDARFDLQWYDYAALALLQVTSLGTEAVILFFVLSGFAMAHSMQTSRSAASFYQRRVVRIWPPYLAAILIALVVCLLMNFLGPDIGLAQEVATQFRMDRLIGMAFYLNVDTTLTAQFWSLPHEIIFYALCPLLLASRGHVIFWFFASIVLLLGGVVLFGPTDAPAGGFVLRHFASTMFYFLSGAIAYHLPQYVPRIRPTTLLCFAAATVALVWPTKVLLFGTWNVISSVATVPLAIMLIYNLPSKPVRSKLNIGHFSYSIYLFHMQFVMLGAFLVTYFTGATQDDMTSYTLWMLAVPIIFGLCWLLYQVVERPCSAYLGNMRARQRSSGVEGAGQVAS